MSEIEYVKLQIAQLSSHVAGLAGFASALLRSLPEGLRTNALQRFDVECEALIATMLATPRDDVDQQIGGLTLLQEALHRSQDDD